MKKKPKPKKMRRVWVIYGDGWLWNGLSPFVTSTQPDREAGIPFASKAAAQRMAYELSIRSPHTQRWTVRQT